MVLLRIDVNSSVTLSFFEIFAGTTVIRNPYQIMAVKMNKWMGLWPLIQSGVVLWVKAVHDLARFPSRQDQIEFPPTTFDLSSVFGGKSYFSILI